MMRCIFIGLVILYTCLPSFGQSWVPVTTDKIEQKGQRDIKPSKFSLFSLDDSKMKSILWQALPESELDVYYSTTIIKVGLPEGTVEEFKIVSYVMMEPDLAVKYPEFKTFYGISVLDPQKSIRIDYTSQGFRAVISSPDKDKIYIDHFQREDNNTRIVYYKKDYELKPTWGCRIGESKPKRINSNSGNRIGNCELITYRLAQATTGSYSLFHGASNSSQSGLVLAAVTTVINRVNEVYESEVGIRLILIANTDLVFYYGTGGGGYPNNGSSADLDQNQTNCTNVIGSANYDIGHVFGTGDGGIAGLGVVCDNSRKAEGYTGRPNPVGDPFTIDYVTHEMGHQFDANHTQNNSCQRNSSTAMEPGSASTIMGYAGICNPNVQNNSDPYFHAVSLQEIKNYTSSGTGNTCELSVSSFMNTPPTVTTQPNYIIPTSTPFALTLQASDAEGHAMTYSWDQMNNTVANMPPVSTNTGGPTFRSISPSTSPTRYFPNLSSIISGANTNTWEVLPAVGRVMNFRGTARDWTGVAGCNSELNLTVTTVASTGPFRVTGLDVPTTWLETQTANITWDVAGSNAGSINTANVSILMSYDGGNTFPVTLLASTPNDGSQQIVVPIGTTSTARIMVRAVGNIFFDINNANITVNVGVPSFELSVSPSTVNLCPNQQSSISLEISSILGFNNPVNLSLSGLPSGITSSFSSNPLLPGQSTSINFNNSNALSGVYPITITGTSGSLTDNVNATINIESQNPTITLNSPSNNATSVSLRPTFSWTSSPGLVTYQLQISRRPDFNSLVLDVSGLTTNTYMVTAPLLGYSEYYWRVRAVNSCGNGAWSNPAFKFETEACLEFVSPNVPLTISDIGTSTVNSVLNISDKGTITDLNVLNLIGLHTYVDDLIFTLVAPSTTNVIIWNRPCTSQDNFNINFDQASTLGNSWPCPPTNGLTYRPSNPGTLNTFNGQAIKGQWKMTVQDVADGDGGSLESWKIKACMTNFCRLTVDNDAPKGAGSLKAALDCAIDGDTIRFASTFMNDTIMLFNENIVTNKRIFIEGDITKNIHLMSTSTNPTIVSSAPNSGFGLRIKGLHIHSSQSTGIGAIQNSGLLTLEDVYLYKSPVSTATIQQNTGGINNISGDCRVME